MLLDSIIEVTKFRHGYHTAGLLGPDELSEEIRCPITRQVLVRAAQTGAALLGKNREELAAEIQHSLTHAKLDETYVSAITDGFKVQFGSARAKILGDSIMGIEPMAGRRPMDLVFRYAIHETQKMQGMQVV